MYSKNTLSDLTGEPQFTRLVNPSSPVNPQTGEPQFTLTYQSLTYPYQGIKRGTRIGRPMVVKTGKGKENNKAQAAAVCVGKIGLTSHILLLPAATRRRLCLHLLSWCEWFYITTDLSVRVPLLSLNNLTLQEQSYE